MNEKAKKVINIALSVLSYVIMAVALLVFASVMVVRLSGGTPSIFGYSFHFVVTDSMEPEIMTNDLVIAKICEPQDVKVGDDLVFHTADPELQGKGIDIVVHRVMAVELVGDEYRFTTQGVKEGANTDKYPATNIIGVRVVTSGFGGKVFMFLSNIRNILFFAMMVVLLLISAYLIKRVVLIVKEEKAKVSTETTDENVRLQEEIERLKREVDQHRNSPDGESASDNATADGESASDNADTDGKDD